MQQAAEKHRTCHQDPKTPSSTKAMTRSAYSILLLRALVCLVAEKTFSGACQDLGLGTLSDRPITGYPHSFSSGRSFRLTRACARCRARTKASANSGRLASGASGSVFCALGRALVSFDLTTPASG
jgi:hypothetical protein